MAGDEPSEPDFEPEELAMLRQLFRGEAHEALEVITSLALGSGAATPTIEHLAEMMRVTHTIKGAAGTVGYHEIVELAHRLEGALAQVQAARVPWTGASSEQLVEIVDGVRAILDGTPGADDTSAIVERIEQFEGSRPLSAATAQDLDRPTASGAPAPTAVDSSGPLVVPERNRLRVDPARLDALMSSAGELLFDRTRIERRVQLLRTLARDVARTRQLLHDGLRGQDGPIPRALLGEIETELANQATILSQTSAALLDETEALRRTIGELQRGLTGLRMESAKNLFLDIARALRGLRRATGTQIELRTSGEQTEFDRSVAEQLSGPLVQLVRNAVVHGVEGPIERAAAGKPAAATLTLSARQDSGHLIITVADDGRGIDTQRMRARFAESGRWNPSRAKVASDDDVLAALFDAKVSSRDDADELAGRGIGLDLVRETIARLGGEISVVSAAGRGTTFTLRLPLSTTVTQALLFKVAGQVYAVPTVHVLDTTIVDATATEIPYRHETIPLLRLEQILGEHATGDKRPAAILSFTGKVFAITVDKLVGPREIVVKPLPPLLEPLSLYAGATISGSGKVQLILDPGQLMHRAYPGAVPALLAADPGSTPVVLAGRALVVDDSRAIREAMTSMLAREGWIVDVAEHGRAALAALADVRYDLVVTDLEMPDVDGFSLIARMRQTPRWAQLPVIVISSRANAESRARVEGLGVRALVAKPITRRKLLEALASR